MINSKGHIQLGQDDSESFPAVCGANKVCIYIFFVLIFQVIKKMYGAVHSRVEDTSIPSEMERILLNFNIQPI